jgi:hypothetical protein
LLGAKEPKGAMTTSGIAEEQNVVLAHRLTIEDLVIGRLYVTEYIAANNMTLSPYPNGKDRFNF